MSAAFGICAFVVLLVVLLVTFRYRPIKLDNFGDIAGIGLPIIMPLIALVSSAMLFSTSKIAHHDRRGALWGTFIGANAFLILTVMNMYSRIELISTDGTSHWVYLFYPSGYVGIPAVIVGTLIGLWVGLVIERRSYGKETA